MAGLFAQQWIVRRRMYEKPRGIAPVGFFSSRTRPMGQEGSASPD